MHWDVVESNPSPTTASLYDLRTELPVTFSCGRKG